MEYKTPGVYIEEITKFPPSIVPVETAIPAFIGYTERTNAGGQSLLNRPVAVGSLLEFEQLFGGPPVLPAGGGTMTVTVDADGAVVGGVTDPNAGAARRFRLASALRHFYDNGGGRCYVVSIGDYDPTGDTDAAITTAHLAGLAAVAKEDEPTLLVFPDLSALVPADPTDAGQVDSTRARYHSVLIQALAQCADLGDRFLISEIWDLEQASDDGIDNFRDGIGTRNLKYGAAYHPYIHTTLPWTWDETRVLLDQPAARNADGSITRPGPDDGSTLEALASSNTTIYGNIRSQLDRFSVILPPGAAMAGIYATVDRTRGVWKSPANESLSSVRRLTVAIDDETQEAMNVHATGKSVNALRFFAGKGHLVWGARTLAGNDNEWRYIAVRRFFNMVEESTRKATVPFVFEPNDGNTWARVKGMIENFLAIQWRQGALAGAKPEDAFYVRVGLGETMTAQDILEGRMNVEIGMAVVRPAEFIVLRFSHKMQEA